jgi:hypothetical protein
MAEDLRAVGFCDETVEFQQIAVNESVSGNRQLAAAT